MDEAERIAAFYRKHGKNPPRHYEHGTEDEIRDNMKLLKPNEWKLQGNKLIGKTDMGLLVQYIPTDYILTGADEDGLPVLKRVVLSK
jgi:hypothetical protein